MPFLAAGWAVMAFSLSHADQIPDTPVSRAINSEAEARARVAEYVGDLKTGEIISQANKDDRVISITGDETPFLRNRINNSKARHLILRDVSLSRVPEKVADKSTWRTFEVFIDSTTGTLLKIVCDYQPLGEHEVGEMTPEYAEQQLRGSGEYLGFPDEPPPVTFIEALRACPHDALLAKQIEALYVIYQRGNLKPRAVWVIALQGIPPVPVRGPRGFNPDLVPLYQRNHVRQYVNAHTGAIMYTSSAPQYPLKDEDNPFLNLPDSGLEQE
jgi:hypothetical protein